MIARIRVAALIVLCFFLASLTIVAQEGRIVRETVYSPSLEGNLFDDSPNRQVTIYLPPSYDTEPERLYPVVYLLHGYTGNHYLWTGGSYTSGNILYSMKSWLARGEAEEMILVMPNSYNRLQGSMYVNSAATGKWADYISKDLVKYMDSNYRTLPQRESRGVIGHSMGGYGGMILGLDYPDVFGCMGSMAGVLDFTQYPARISSAYAQGAKLKDLSHFYGQSFDVRAAIAWSAALTPNPNNPPFYADFPWEYDESSKLVQNQAVWDRFLESDILRRLSASEEILRRMRAIYIDCGTSDGFGFIADARKVHEILEGLGIEHTYKEFPGSHTCCVMTSTGNALGVFSDAMEYTAVSGVEPAGRLATTWGRIRVAWR